MVVVFGFQPSRRNSTTSFYDGLTAFACIWYFRHELFVNAQSFVFNLLFPLLIARFHQFDRCEAVGVGDMPIAAQDLGGTSGLVRKVVPAGVVSQRTALYDDPLRQPTWVNCSGLANASRPPAEHGRPSVVMRRYR